MILEGCWDGLGTLSFGLSQFHGHGFWLVCEVALSFCIFLVKDLANLQVHNNTLGTMFDKPNENLIKFYLKKKTKSLLRIKL